MPDIPESLIRRMAEAQANELGLTVEEVEASLREGTALSKPTVSGSPGRKPAPSVPSPPPVATTPAPADVAPAVVPAPVPADEAPMSAPAPAAPSAGGSLDDLLARAAAVGGLPASLVKRSAAAKAKAKGVSIEAILAEMAGGEAPVPAPAIEAVSVAPTPVVEAPMSAPAPAAPSAGGSLDDLLARAAAVGGLPASLVKRSAAAKAKAKGVSIEAILAEMAGGEAPVPAPAIEVVAVAPTPAAASTAPVAPAPIDVPAPAAGEGKVASVVSPRPLVPPANTPEGVRTQRLLTVVKARAIQQVKTEPTDKVNTWPHLLLIEFVALLAMMALLLILSSALQAPLLDPANFNATPNPSKAPWYFLGLQELLSYFDPQIAGVTVPTIVGLIGFMMIPYLDRNPSTKPSDRKFAIMAYTFFLTGAATLTIVGVLFRGKGFNFAYPWRDGIFFDDLKDWVNFE